jgi:hypothetical protein
MQVMPSTYQDVSGEAMPDSFVNDFPAQVDFAFDYFDQEIYRLFNERVKFEAIGQKYGVRGDELHTFITLSVVNAYKAGPTRMVNVLKAFLGGFAARSLPDDFEGSGLALFHLMTSFSRNYDTVDRYGPQSQEYSFLAVAGAQSLAEHFGTEYGLAKEDWTDYLPQIGGLIGAVLSDSLVDPITKKGGLGANIPLSIGHIPLKVLKDVKSILQLASNRKNSKKPISKSKARLKRAQKVAKPGAKKTTSKQKSPAAILSRRSLLKGGLATAGGTGLYAFGEDILDRLSDADLQILSEAYSAEEVPEMMEYLNRRGIFLTSSTQGFNEDGSVDGRGRTALVSLRKDVWAALEQILEDLDMLDKTTNPHDAEAVVITGMAEDAGHSVRTHGHGPGYAIDLRNNRSNQTARRLSNRLTQDTNRLNTNQYAVETEHPLRQGNELLVGDRIFRYNVK